MLFFFIRKPLLASLTKAKMMQRSPNEIEHCNLLSTFPNPTLTQTGAKGFRMKIELCLITNTIKGLFAEDPIHCVKKFCCKVIVIAPIVFICLYVITFVCTNLQLDSAKVLEMGFFTCVHGHLQYIYDIDASVQGIQRRKQSGGNSSGLWRTDVYKQDRQNFMACVRRASYKVRRALIR